MTLVIDVSCKGSSQTRRFVLRDQQQLEVGRANEELKLVSDARLSRKHFTLRYEGGQIEIRHHSRTNPTLIAVDGSSNFQKVRGSHWEAGNCRLVAGAHRFVLTIEKPDSVIAPTLSGDENAEFWSDVEGQQASSSSDGAAAFASEEPVDTVKGANVTRRSVVAETDAEPDRVANQQARHDFGSDFGDDSGDDESDFGGDAEEDLFSDPSPGRNTTVERSHEGQSRRPSAAPEQPVPSSSQRNPVKTEPVKRERESQQDRPDQRPQDRQADQPPPNRAGSTSPDSLDRKADDIPATHKKPFFPITDDFFED